MHLHDRQVNEEQGKSMMSASTLDVVTLLFFFFFTKCTTLVPPPSRKHTEPDRKSERQQCSRRAPPPLPQATSTVTKTTTRWARRLDGDGRIFRAVHRQRVDFLKGCSAWGGLLLTVHQAESQSLLVSPAAERRRGRGGRGSYGHTPAAAGSCRKGRGAAPDP